jgi:hypothetical protein
MWDLCRLRMPRMRIKAVFTYQLINNEQSANDLSSCAYSLFQKHTCDKLRRWQSTAYSSQPMGARLPHHAGYERHRSTWARVSGFVWGVFPLVFFVVITQVSCFIMCQSRGLLLLLLVQSSPKVSIYLSLSVCFLYLYLPPPSCKSFHSDEYSTSLCLFIDFLFVPFHAPRRCRVTISP